MVKSLFSFTKWAILLGMVFMVSCKKDARNELFELNHTVDFEIQPGLNTFDTHFFVVTPLASSYDEKLATLGIMDEDVKSVETKDAFLASTFHDVNLKFIYQISVYIFDPFNPDDKIEFCYLDPVPYKNATNIQLFPGLADISHWVDQDFFGIEIRLTFREVTSSLTSMRLEFDLSALGN